MCIFGQLTKLEKDTMVSVEEASGIIFSNLFKPHFEIVPLEKAIGKTLAEEIRADRHFPPFDRVAMDGIAIAHEQWAKGVRRFPISFTQAAGEPQRELTIAASCVEVMTGAVLPKGADTVIRYEDLVIENGIATVRIEAIQAGQNVHAVGADAKTGAMLLLPGASLSAAEIALLASVGKTHIQVFRFPSVVVVSTGDELVPIDETPLAHQVRRSNVYALSSAVALATGTPAVIVHLPDNIDVLRSKVAELLSGFDVLILSGGVSKGKFDFIPRVLEECGVQKKFHEVTQRPGKPFWFGCTRSGKVAFALPGNPVSTFMCFYKYVHPWLIKSTGGTVALQSAILEKEVSFQPRLTYFLQVMTVNKDGRLIAMPVFGGGSGDFANLKDVTGFLELPPDRTTFSAGEAFPYIPFRI
jgi:molybdopterin molybdotransferase